MKVTIEGTTAEIRAQILELAKMFRAEPTTAAVPESRVLTLVIDDDGIRTRAQQRQSREMIAAIAGVWQTVLRGPCIQLVESGRASMEYVERVIEAKAGELRGLGWTAVELEVPRSDGGAYGRIINLAK